MLVILWLSWLRRRSYTNFQTDDEILILNLLRSAYDIAVYWISKSLGETLLGLK